MNYYAHTAEDENGNRLPERSGKWQPLSVHLSNVADLAMGFAEAFGPLHHLKKSNLTAPVPCCAVKQLTLFLIFL